MCSFIYSFPMTPDMEGTRPDHPRSLSLQDRPRTKEELLELQMQQWRQRCHTQAPRRRPLQHSPGQSPYHHTFPSNVRTFTSPSSSSPTSSRYFIPVSPSRPDPQPLSQSLPMDLPGGRNFCHLVQDAPRDLPGGRNLCHLVQDMLSKSMRFNHSVRPSHFSSCQHAILLFPTTEKLTQ